MSDLIVELDSNSLEAAVKEGVVLVDFWEPWCGPCQIQLPVLEEVARRVAGRAIIAKVNVDEAQKLAAHFGIQGLPTLVLFKNGKVVRQFVGRHSAAALTAAIEDAAQCPTITHEPLNADASTVDQSVKLTTKKPRPPTTNSTNSTLYAHLLQARRGRTKPLRVLVVHDGLPARKRVERLLMRIRGRLAADLQIACVYQRIDELRCQDVRTKGLRIELVFLAASCSATLPQETLAGVTSLLPSLKANHGAVAFLSGTNVPRRLDVMLVEQFLRTHSERAGVAFFSGCMPGLGCLGCRTPKREKPGRSGAKHVCLLHAPGNVRAPTSPAASRKSKPTKMRAPPVPRAKSGKPARVASERQLRRERPGQNAR